MPKSQPLETISFYDSLEPSELETVRASEAVIESVEANDAEGTFRMGEALNRTHAAIAEGKFLKWCRLKWPYHRSYAYDFMRVADALAPYRSRLVAARVPRASLIDLSSAPEHVTQVLDAFELGKRLKVSEVASMLKCDGAASKAPEGPENVGGIAGLRQLYSAKAKFLMQFVERVDSVVMAIREALNQAPPGGRVAKGALARQIVLAARHARHELENLCLFIEPDARNPSVPRVVPFPEGSRWREVTDLLFELGGVESWPASAELDRWLREKVLPLLEWATWHGKSGSPGTAGAPSQAEPAASGADESGLPHRTTGQAASAEEYVAAMEMIANVRVDMEPYRIPHEEVVEGVQYEIGTGTGEPRWQLAVLRQNGWAGSGFSECLASVPQVRAAEADVRSAVGFLAWMRARFRREGASEDSFDRLGKEMASVFADLLVCGRSTDDLPGICRGARRSIAEALHLDCVAQIPQQEQEHETQHGPLACWRPQHGRARAWLSASVAGQIPAADFRLVARTV